MDKWDQSKLEEVIEKKHGEKEISMPKTEIVSFLKDSASFCFCTYVLASWNGLRNSLYFFKMVPSKTTFFVRFMTMQEKLTLERVVGIQNEN